MSKKLGHLEIDGVEYYPRPSFPIGSIITTNGTFDPSIEYGGTWEQIAKGRTLVGVDSGDSSFNRYGLMGGEKMHRLTMSEMPRHDHSENSYHGAPNSRKLAQWYYHIGTEGFKLDGGSSQKYPYADMLPQGGDQPHNNLQPYFTVYFYIRTA